MLEKLRYLTAGESHGKGLLGIIDGIPANLKISEDYIKFQLNFPDWEMELQSLLYLLKFLILFHPA